MTDHAIKRWTRYKSPPASPKNLEQRLALCGAIPNTSPVTDQADIPDFPGITAGGAGESAKLWVPFQEVAGHDPDTTPQPTGNCVAAAADDVIEFTQCIEIAAGERETFRPIYNPFHYFTGRELVGKGRLRGRPGSIGGWQAKAIMDFGVIELTEGLPAYNRRNCDAWGDGRKAQGQDPRDYLEKAATKTIRETARVQTWPLMRDALYNLHACTIASRRGYTMKPGRSGFHTPSGSWNHQMSVMGYSEEGPEKDHWVVVKNQWGNVHGRVTTPQGDQVPPGHILVHLPRFVQEHLEMRGCEAIAFSGFNGWKDRSKLRHKINWGKHRTKWGK